MNEKEIETALQTYKALTHIYRKVEDSPGYTFLLNILKEGEKYYREECNNAKERYYLEEKCVNLLSALNMDTYENVIHLINAEKNKEKAYESWAFFYSKWRDIYSIIHYNNSQRIIENALSNINSRGSG